MSSTIRLIQVVKWPFLMAWSKVLLTGLNRSVWYHLASSVLIISARSLSDAGCCLLGVWSGLLVKLTCNMPDVVEQFTSSTVIPYLTTLRGVVVKFAMQPSSHSCPIDMKAPDCRWGEMCDVRTRV